jgi:tol-pal system protein YbgF
MTARLSLAIAASLTGLLLTAAAPLAPVERTAPREQGLRLAGIFGESDEEKAERAANAQKQADQDAAIAELRAQVRDLEDTVRRLTGQNEVLSHKVEQFDSKIDRMKKDFDYKVCTVMAQQVGGDTGSLPCEGMSSGGNAPAARYTPPPPASSEQGGITLIPPPNSAPRELAPPPQDSLAPPPGSLGTLPRTQVPEDTAAANASPFRSEFDGGLNLLGKAQYDEARATFRSYADNHPKDSLAPQAVFWVGNIAYVQKDYPNAARAFAEGIKKYPSSGRAPESMLKLGQSLVAMGQKKEGCFTLGSLPATYPKAPKATVAQAAAAQKAAGCK